MIKLIALYNQPDDTAAFDQHYDEVHTLLVRDLPDLRRLEIARITGAPNGTSPYYLIAEMYWDDHETMRASLASPAGRAVGKDVQRFAGSLISLHIAEVVETRG